MQVVQTVSDVATYLYQITIQVVVACRWAKEVNERDI